ncbi:MAG: hypothetical protein HQK52_19705 [Oligoflexia bacterium]|nr:hypothetical protein [Oligoflexia bacterium]
MVRQISRDIRVGEMGDSLKEFAYVTSEAIEKLVKRVDEGDVTESKKTRIEFPDRETYIDMLSGEVDEDKKKKAIESLWERLPNGLFRSKELVVCRRGSMLSFCLDDGRVFYPSLQWEENGCRVVVNSNEYGYGVIII